MRAADSTAAVALSVNVAASFILVVRALSSAASRSLTWSAILSPLASLSICSRMSAMALSALVICRVIPLYWVTWRMAVVMAPTVHGAPGIVSSVHSK